MLKRKILLVEDEADLANFLKLRLEAAGFEVAIAYDGKNALHEVRRAAPDLVILDLMLPGMDGYRVCRLLKYDAKFSEIPVIIMSAKSDPADKELGEKVGADKYLAKPFEADVLIRHIKESLKER